MESVDSHSKPARFLKPVPIFRSGMASQPLVAFLGSVICVIVLVYLAIAPHRDANSNVVRIYCASGLKDPVELLIAKFEQQSSTEFEIVRTGGSGELAGQIGTEYQSEVARGADLYITADDYLLSRLHDQGIVTQQFSLAQQSAVIAAPFTSELQADDLAGLINTPNLRFGIASERAAIGKLTRRLAKAMDQLGLLESRKTTDSENVMVLAQALVAGSLDAAIVWDTTVSQINAKYPSSGPVIKTIANAGPSEVCRANIAVGMIKGTENRDACLAFCHFLASSSDSQTTFEQFGYSFGNNQ